MREKFGVEPSSIPDYLALVGDAADGYPGIAGIGPTAARGSSNATARSSGFPTKCWATAASSRCCSRRLATLRTDAPLFDDVDELRWHGPTSAFDSLPAGIVDDALAGRVAALVSQA